MPRAALLVPPAALLVLLQSLSLSPANRDPGRRPKLVLELGCAGAGKSSRVSECYERFGVEKLNLVLADGDLVR